jgi:CobQ-like glutamine amidotransferase family enzyme
MKIHIGHLYPSTMSTYGDMGNVTCLRKRAEWRGLSVEVHALEIGVPIPKQIDLYFFGGGQDAAQTGLAADLLTRSSRLKSDISSGIPLLAICGGYQLLGKSYTPFGAEAIPGIGLFPVTTTASTDRMIGNLVIEVDRHLSVTTTHKTIVGFENHSGKTYLEKGNEAHPLGQVLVGFGNNGQDHSEGCVINHAIGCYLHGSLLPKNPHVADWLLEKACQQHEAGYALEPLDDTVEWQAHDYCIDRYSKA